MMNRKPEKKTCTVAVQQKLVPHHIEPHSTEEFGDVDELLRDLAEAFAPVHRHAPEHPIGLVLAHAAAFHQDAFGALDELSLREFQVGLEELRAQPLVLVE